MIEDFIREATKEEMEFFELDIKDDFEFDYSEFEEDEEETPLEKSIKEFEKEINGGKKDE